MRTLPGAHADFVFAVIAELSPHDGPPIEKVVRRCGNGSPSVKFHGKRNNQAQPLIYLACCVCCAP